MILEKDSIIFSGILSILLILVFLITVPFHEDFQGLDTLSVVQILLAIFLAVIIFGFNHFTNRRIQKKSKRTNKKSV